MFPPVGPTPLHGPAMADAKNPTMGQSLPHRFQTSSGIFLSGDLRTTAPSGRVRLRQTSGAVRLTQRAGVKRRRLVVPLSYRRRVSTKALSFCLPPFPWTDTAYVRIDCEHMGRAVYVGTNKRNRLSVRPNLIGDRKSTSGVCFPDSPPHAWASRFQSEDIVPTTQAAYRTATTWVETWR